MATGKTVQDRFRDARSNKLYNKSLTINATAAEGLDMAKAPDEIEKSQRGAVLDGPPIAPEPELYTRHQISQVRTVPGS
jgi:hypothetical protein